MLKKVKLAMLLLMPSISFGKTDLQGGFELEIKGRNTQKVFFEKSDETLDFVKGIQCNEVYKSNLVSPHVHGTMDDPQVQIIRYPRICLLAIGNREAIVFYKKDGEGFREKSLSFILKEEQNTIFVSDDDAENNEVFVTLKRLHQQEENNR